MMSLQFKVDPETKKLVKVTEAEATEAELRAEIQVDADNAQNRLNEATAHLTETETQLEALQAALEAAQLEKEAAEEEVEFQSHRTEELDAAVQLVNELAQSSSEEAAAGSSEEQPVEVHVTAAV